MFFVLLVTVIYFVEKTQSRNLVARCSRREIQTIFHSRHAGGEVIVRKNKAERIMLNHFDSLYWIGMYRIPNRSSVFQFRVNPSFVDGEF